MKKLRDANEKLRKQVDTYNTANDELTVSVQQANRKNETLQSRFLALQQENEFNKLEAERYRKQASEASEQCGDLQDQLDQSMAMTANNTFDISFAEDFGVIKGELSSQLSEIKTLKRENSKLRAELLVLRERNTSIEVLKEEKRSLEVKALAADRLSVEVGTLEAQLEALNAEHAKWYVFPQYLLIYPLI
jgi:mitotic spindle assembly checkpoint protein MAD1